MPSIRFLKSGNQIAISSDRFVVSSGSNADCILNDAMCNSEKHCEIQRMPSGYLLIPAEEVSVNGVTLKSSVYLNTGDRICIGHTLLLFEEETFEEEQTRLGYLEKHTEAGFELALKDSMELILGRESTRQVHRLDHPLVSRRHASLFKSGSTVTIKDLGSSNGTFVNGKRIHSATKIQSHDEIGIGPFAFAYINGSLIPQSATSRSANEFHALGSTLVCSGIGRSIAKTGQQLLHEIELEISPGQFVCIVGPSGAGKSTLLRALANREAPDHRIKLTGNVALDGLNLRTHFDQLKHHFAFVPQHEILFDDLSLEASLRYTARLRLPSDANRAEITQQVDRVLKTVQLEDSRKKQIGNLSGGQRKRAALANELLAQPSLLFLDEVTSGLDELTDSEMMKLFREVADEGKTVVCVTHSVACVPRDCHLVVALTRFGRLAFQGTPKDALKYFGVERISDMYAQLAVDSPENADEVAARFLSFKLSSKNATTKQVLESVKTSVKPPRHFDYSFSLRQFLILLERYGQRIAKDTKTNLLRVLQVGIVGLLMCSVFGKVDVDSPEALAATQNLSFILVLSCFWFGCNNSSKEIVRERAIFEQERSVVVKPHSFAWEKFVALTTIAVVQSMILLSGVRAWCELPGDLITWIALVSIVSMVGTALGLAISASARREEAAIAAVPIILIPQIILAGAVSQLEGVNLWLAKVAITAHAGFQTSSEILGHTSERFPGDSRFWVGMMLAQVIVAFWVTLYSLQRKHG